MFRRHASFNIESFRPEYWGIFTECTLEVVSSNEDKETQIAWRQLLQTLTFYMKYTFSCFFCTSVDFIAMHILDLASNENRYTQSE